MFLAWTRIFFENFGTNIDLTITKTLAKKGGPCRGVQAVDLENGLDDKVDPFGSICRVKSLFLGIIKATHRLVMSQAWTHILFKNFQTNIGPTNTKTLVPKGGACGGGEWSGRQGRPLRIKL